MGITTGKKIIYCDFCRQTQYEVERMIDNASYNSNPAICNYCIESAYNIIKGDKNDN